MKLRREFSGPVSSDDAIARAEKLLRSMKYKQVECATHLKFERGRSKSSLYAARPRSFHSMLHLWVEGHGPENTKVTMELEVPKVFQPPHHIAELFFEGELLDIREGILTNIPPAVNRQKENKMAGTAHLVYLVAAAGISFGVARVVGPHTTFEGATAWVLVFLCFVYFANKMPFQLIEFKVRHPKGAKIIPDPEPEPPVAPTKKKQTAGSGADTI